MKKLIFKIVIVIFISGIGFYGCLDSGKQTTPQGGAILLTEKHSGWGLTTCFSCHDVITMVSTTALSVAHAQLVEKEPQKLDTSVCLSCHGLNGVENPIITGCSLCHNSTSDLGKTVNPLFISTHDNVSLSSPARAFLLDDKNCSKCHNVVGHTGETKLDVKSSLCINCHAGFETATHKSIADCRACHKDIEFTRSVDNVISGHISTVNLQNSNCLYCHNKQTPLPANTRFNISHTTAEALTVENCVTCHQVDLGHFNKTSTLEIIADRRCIFCHTDSATISHFNSPTCVMCHGIDSFIRDITTQDILKHSIDSTACVRCHVTVDLVPRFNMTHPEAVKDIKKCADCHNLNITGHYGKKSLLKPIDKARCLECHTVPVPGGVHDTVIGGYGVCANSNCHEITGFVRQNGTILKHNNSRP